MNVQGLCMSYPCFLMQLARPACLLMQLSTSQLKISKFYAFSFCTSFCWRF
ncbi:hypothetical protein M758_12G180000 [Ceratodon purpureus]|nr:hypothetical protein M758_12G180000 [Ceratodon purpureus]